MPPPPRGLAFRMRLWLGRRWRAVLRRRALEVRQRRQWQNREFRRWALCLRHSSVHGYDLTHPQPVPVPDLSWWRGSSQPVEWLRERFRRWWLRRFPMVLTYYMPVGLYRELLHRFPYLFREERDYVSVDGRRLTPEFVSVWKR
jgi:hypothetical protein